MVARRAPGAAPTLSASGSGHTLPAATYYVVTTQTNGVGETTASAASTGQAVTLGEQMVVTPAALQTGNTAHNIYIGTASTGPFYLAATGVTTTTYTFAAPLPAFGTAPGGTYAVQPPTANSTAYEWVDAAGNTINFAVANIRAAKVGNLDRLYKKSAWIVDTLLRGDPMPYPAAIKKLQESQVAFATIAQALADIGTLFDANSGTFAQSTTGGVGTVASKVRVWP